jgi:hypothetical protein
MIHTLCKEYKWSKHEVDEAYPEEVIILLKFLAFERKDEVLSKKLEYYKNHVDLIHIQHGDPEKLRDSFVSAIEKLQNIQIQINNAKLDDDLPDYARLNALKQALSNNKR